MTPDPARALAAVEALVFYAREHLMGTMVTDAVHALPVLRAALAPGGTAEERAGDERGGTREMSEQAIRETLRAEIARLEALIATAATAKRELRHVRRALAAYERSASTLGVGRPLAAGMPSGGEWANAASELLSDGGAHSPSELVAKLVEAGPAQKHARVYAMRALASVGVRVAPGLYAKRPEAGQHSDSSAN